MRVFFLILIIRDFYYTSPSHFIAFYLSIFFVCVLSKFHLLICKKWQPLGPILPIWRYKISSHFLLRFQLNDLSLHLPLAERPFDDIICTWDPLSGLRHQTRAGSYAMGQDGFLSSLHQIQHNSFLWQPFRTTPFSPCDDLSIS